MAFDRNRFKALFHYICWQCKSNPSTLGAVKINKALWVADFTSYYRSGEPLTGTRYVKRQYGSVPSAIVPVLQELEAEGKISSQELKIPALVALYTFNQMKLKYSRCLYGYLPSRQLS